jgi:O-succinylbenzoate synthase
VAIHDGCHDGCIPCWVGATPQSAIGARLGIALAAKQNFSYPADFFDSEELFAEDVAEPPRPVRDQSDGVLRIPLWTDPGIGVQPDLDVLEKLCLARAKL